MKRDGTESPDLLIYYAVEELWEKMVNMQIGIPLGDQEWDVVLQRLGEKIRGSRARKDRSEGVWRSGS